MYKCPGDNALQCGEYLISSFLFLTINLIRSPIPRAHTARPYRSQRYKRGCVYHPIADYRLPLLLLLLSPARTGQNRRVLTPAHPAHPAHPELTQLTPSSPGLAPLAREPEPCAQECHIPYW
jgi:hypothetical protein